MARIEKATKVRQVRKVNPIDQDGDDEALVRVQVLAAVPIVPVEAKRQREGQDCDRGDVIAGSPGLVGHHGGEMIATSGTCCTGSGGLPGLVVLLPASCLCSAWPTLWSVIVPPSTKSRLSIISQHHGDKSTLPALIAFLKLDKYRTAIPGRWSPYDGAFRAALRWYPRRVPPARSASVCGTGWGYHWYHRRLGSGVSLDRRRGLIPSF